MRYHIEIYESPDDPTREGEFALYATASSLREAVRIRRELEAMGYDRRASICVRWSWPPAAEAKR